MTFPKFYFGITGRSGYEHVVPATVPVIVSAMSLYSFKARPSRRWPDWALDSGGFVALRSAGDYPFSPDDYLAAVAMWRPVWAASMDYPCEPELCATTNHTPSERIAATVELATYLCARSDRIVPVLQGYTAEEYADCWRGLPRTGRVAIGSLCRRQGLPEIRELVRRLRELDLPPRRHGFGVKLTALRYPDVASFLTSVDSNAWEYMERRERQRLLLGLPLYDRLRWTFAHYQRQVAALEARPRQGVLL
mgnify:CR=1 FL=1